MTDRSLFRLLQLADSAFPIGTYSHSFGIETLIQNEQITNAAAAEQAVRFILRHSIANLDGIACVQAHRRAQANAGQGLGELNQILTAMKWPEEQLKASLDLGTRLGNLAIKLGWIEELPLTPLHHSICFGWVCSRLGIDECTAISAYLMNSAVSLVSACVRLVPIGHTSGQRIITMLADDLFPALTRQCCDTSLEDIGGFAPIYEEACVLHSQLESRIFQS